MCIKRYFATKALRLKENLFLSLYAFVAITPYFFGIPPKIAPIRVKTTRE